MDLYELCREGMRTAGRILAEAENDPVGDSRAIGLAISILQDVRKVAQAAEAAERLRGLLGKNRAA